jgi:hypothetical protein
MDIAKGIELLFGGFGKGGGKTFGIAYVQGEGNGFPTKLLDLGDHAEGFFFLAAISENQVKAFCGKLSDHVSA